MTPEEREGLERTLKILHALERLGVVEQVIAEDGIRWRAKGSKKRWAAIQKALGLK